MKTEIEKMYINAGIEKQASYYCSFEYGAACPYDNVTCPECPYYKEEDEPQYPDFTAEKQLELIKWLSQHTYRNYIKFRFDICGLWYCECNMSNSDMHHTFEEALAESINYLWQSLPEQAKKEIRRILE